jgi:glycine betaine/proline transport system ATP-binding protein
MQQRVGLARALSTEPQILLMDEPFSALDPIVRRELAEQFVEVSRKLEKTAVFITHDLDEAIRIGDRVAIMRDGKIVQIGTPLEIINSPVDDYVQAFVKGVGRLHLLTAEAVMDPWRARDGIDICTLPAVSTDATLSSVIDELAASASASAITVKREGRPVGMISRESLLAAIRSRLD